MRRLLLILAVVAATIFGGCEQACPAALLTGLLSEQAGELVVIPDGGGPPERVNWPAGHAVRRDGDSLVVVNIFGWVVAREGDRVRLGGGATSQTGTWDVCGLFEANT
ncbi:MAG: hypothetical protein ABI725_07575 [Chloroflexota bacterium]